MHLHGVFPVKPYCLWVLLVFWAYLLGCSGSLKVGVRLWVLFSENQDVVFTCNTHRDTLTNCFKKKCSSPRKCLSIFLPLCFFLIHHFLKHASVSLKRLHRRSFFFNSSYEASYFGHYFCPRFLLSLLKATGDNNRHSELSTLDTSNNFQFCNFPMTGKTGWDLFFQFGKIRRV